MLKSLSHVAGVEAHAQVQSPTDAIPVKVLALNTLCFAFSFAVWVVFGPSMRQIATELHISASQAALLKSVPILLGAVARIPVGILSDRLGARLVYPLLMLATAGGVFWVSLSMSYAALLVGGLVLGLAGTTFAVGVQSVSSWTPKAKQGTALGIFGAGNVGTAITTFGLPFLLVAFGWRGAFRVYAAAMVVAAAGYFLLMRNAPRAGAPLSLKQLLAPLASGRTWRFGLYYMATFGVFVATVLTITDVYIDGYKLSVKTAGLLATTFTFSASLIRILGGRLADRFGARSVTRWSMLGVAAGLFPVAFAPPLAVTVGLVFLAGLCMGIGMASVMRYVPDYFPRSVGAVGGIVGAIGGVAGFVLPMVSTTLKVQTGSVYYATLPLVGVAVAASAVQFVVVRRIQLAKRRTRLSTQELASADFKV